MNKYIFITTLILSILVYIVTLMDENHQKENYEQERNEFRLQWEEYNKKQAQERYLLYLELVSICERNPKWNKFREGYIREANDSDKDMNTQMFDEMILFNGYYTLERFMKLYFHYDSEERELLRKYNSIHISKLDYYSYPNKLRNFKNYKEYLSDDFSFIHKQSPIENFMIIFIGGLLCSPIYEFLKRKINKND